MIAQFREITENQHLRVALDWTVFGIGVLSLTIAIAATVVTHTVNANSDSAPAPAAETISTTG